MMLKRFPPRLQSADGLRGLQLKGLKWTVGHAYRNSLFYRARLDAAGVTPAGIRSLDELPASDVLSPRQIDSWLQTAGQPRAASDSDMGLDETEPDQMTLDQAPAEKPAETQASEGSAAT